ncbi:hypothetical protein KJN74_06035, partial [Candidatus Bathyarchaeota archaeon]|nr:hypothetical protein [Candidatus Bathyarchaeota archaeon]
MVILYGAKSILFYFIPLVVLIRILGLVVFYLSKKTEETDYEKEMKRLRQLLIKGQLDRDSFLKIRDNLKAEDLFSDESKRIDELIKNKQIDSDTYLRMKKVLEYGFNE